MSGWLAPIRLHGAHCALEPLAPEHHDELVAAVRDGELWTLWYTAIPSPETMRAEIARRLDQPSRRAIERLGARLDGILRNHQRAGDGSLRDTCVYSILDTEWPAVKTHLRWQLDKPR
ncbi:MAG: GNAT family N-acetyltransferase [Burkholderiaceae bacterium]